MDVFSIGLQLAFAAVFVVVLLRYVRDPRPVNRDLVFVAGAVAGWFVLVDPERAGARDRDERGAAVGDLRLHPAGV